LAELTDQEKHLVRSVKGFGVSRSIDIVGTLPRKYSLVIRPV